MEHDRGVPRAMAMDHDEHKMTPKHKREMTRDYHVKTLWIPLALLVLAAWLATAPFTLGYTDPGQVGSRVDEITRMRDLALPAVRGLWLTYSDVVSAVLLAIFALLSLQPGRVWSRWAACAVGVWLLFAPLVLWAPTAGAYLNNTLIGVLVIALTILIPMMPGMMLVKQPGPEVPPGWSYNPSSWYQRAPLAALAWAGFFFSRYLAAYQLGYISLAADPFFGADTMRVLDSQISLAFPVSDAGLGATAITLEALMAYMGGTSRWRTMPWMVTFFGILVIPLGVAHVILVILQPVMVGAWCTFCIAAASVMLIMIPLALDEVVAMGQFLGVRRRAGDPFWQTFFKGGTLEGGQESDTRRPDYPASLRRMVLAGVWGVTLPWTLVASIALGVWILASPEVLPLSGAAANAIHLLGAAIVTVAAVATAELARAGRYLNVLLGAAVAVTGLLPGAGGVAAWLNVVAGTAVALLSLPRGPVLETYGSADRFIR